MSNHLSAVLVDAWLSLSALGFGLASALINLWLTIDRHFESRAQQRSSRDE